MARKKDYSKPIGPVYARNLRSKAFLGDQSAYNELIERNKALAQKANRRMTNLEKAGYTRWAYNRAITHIESIDGVGARRFNRNLTDVVELQMNIMEMSKFIDSDTSTVPGNRAIDMNTINSFRDKGLNIAKVDIEAFFDILKSDAWEDLKKYQVSSGVLIEDMVRLSQENKVSWERVLEEYEKVANNQITYDVALENLGVPF